MALDFRCDLASSGQVLGEDFFGIPGQVLVETRC